MPTLVVKSDILKLKLYPNSEKDADDLLLDFETSCIEMRIGYEDISLVAPDGAANARKFAALLSEMSTSSGKAPVPNIVCRIHDLASSAHFALTARSEARPARQTSDSELAVYTKMLAASTS